MSERLLNKQEIHKMFVKNVFKTLFQWFRMK